MAGIMADDSGAAVAAKRGLTRRVAAPTMRDGAGAAGGHGGKLGRNPDRQHGRDRGAAGGLRPDLTGVPTTEGA